MKGVDISHLLDTNICSYLMRSMPARVVDRLAALGPERVGVSVVTAIELREGAELTNSPKRYHSAIDAFLAEVSVLALAPDAAPIAGRIRAHLRRAGTRIGDLDSLIAAHALSLELTLVTHNTREFRRVPGLDLEDWAA
jgi:tRNA(fMet)-specific endonuclease VapC